MRFIPEVLPMPQLRIVHLTLLTSLAFGAVSTVFSTPLTAQTQQDLPTTVPDLSGYDRETRQSIELACIVKKSDSPVAYGTCLNRQIASLQGSLTSPPRAAEPTNQWKPVTESFYDLIQRGYKLVGVGHEDSKAGIEQMYFLQKDNSLYHCYEWRRLPSSELPPMPRYSANCSMLVQPFFDKRYP